MNLTENERKVLSCVFFRADAALRDVAAETELREHTVRRCLQNLLERKVIRCRAFINPFAAGLGEYITMLSMPGIESTARDRLVKAFVDSPMTTFVGTVDGDYHLAVMFVARNIAESSQLFEEARSAAANHAFEATTSACTGVTFFAPKYYGFLPSKISRLRYGCVPATTSLDAVDHALLHALSSLTTYSVTEVARKLKMPDSTVAYRLGALRERGVIVGFGYSVVPFEDGLFAYTFEIKAGGMPEKIRTRLVNYCAQQASFSYVIEAVGSFDFQVGARLPDLRHAGEVSERLRREFAPYITGLSIIPANRYHKLTPHPFSGSAQAARQRTVNS